ncbi:TPA: hypothetical protein ACH3X1_015712 [Trebouxia sp. C0004]
MEYHCFGRPYCEEPALESGDWVMSLADLLNSAVWSEGTVVNEALLKHLQNLVEQIGEGKSGNPYRERIASEFNLLARAMLLLDLPNRELTVPEELAPTCILDHILNSLVSGSQHDYDIFMDWMAYMAQNPGRKFAYMPFFVGDEGTGKGVIITKLLLPLFGKCTNFDSVTCKFHAAIEFKSIVCVDEGMHVSKKPYQERMKTLISEDTARFETKFRDAHFSNSFHNFIGASNYPPEQVMKLNAKMRRYIFFRTKMLPYSAEKWGQLHGQVSVDSIRELFWYELRNRDVSHIKPGRAPENDFMQTAVAQSAPEAIGCHQVPHASLPGSSRRPAAQRRPRLVWQQQQVASHPEALVLKERSADIPGSMTNLLGAQLEDALVKQDLAVNHARRNGAATCTPSYIRSFRRDLERLELVVGVPGMVAGVKIRSTVQLPTVQSLRWLIQKAGYLTDHEIAQSDALYAD